MTWLLRLVNLVLDAAKRTLKTYNTLIVYCSHGEKSARATIIMMASLASSRKARKQSFSASEIAVLTVSMEENHSIIQSKPTKCHTVARREIVDCCDRYHQQQDFY